MPIPIDFSHSKKIGIKCLGYCCSVKSCIIIVMLYVLISKRKYFINNAYRSYYFPMAFLKHKDFTKHTFSSSANEKEIIFKHLCMVWIVWCWRNSIIIFFVTTIDFVCFFFFCVSEKNSMLRFILINMKFDTLKKCHVFLFICSVWFDYCFVNEKNDSHEIKYRFYCK